ncbi:MAG: translation initiation factor IF-2 [Bacteroidales bacterium]|nr:translation initiation factor IF-2 [Bacteroidales bacterium]
MIPRLGKAAREFNVATSTIVEFLQSKNFQVEDSINSKLTAEMYDLLVEKYQTDKAVREKANQIEIGTASKAATVLIQEEDEQEQQETEVAVKTMPVVEKKSATAPVQEKEKKPSVKPSVAEKAEPVETPVVEAKKQEQPVQQVSDIEPKQETEEQTSAPENEKKNESAEHQEESSTKIKGPKIIGKIDIEDIEKPKKKTKAEKESKSSEKSTKTAKAKKGKTDEPSAQNAVEDNVEKQNHDLDKSKETQTKKPIKEKEVALGQDASTANFEESKNSNVQAETIVPLVQNQEETEVKKVEKPVPEHIETKVPQLKGATTVGKIDLDAINSITKPKKKSKEEHLREAKKRIEAEKKFAAEQQRKMATEYVQKNNLNINVDNFIETTVEKLSGVKVVDKIDVDTINNKSTDKESNKKKEKRKRINKFSPEDKYAAIDEKEKKNSNHHARKKDKHREKHPDISLEDVEMSIKKTMAKMAPLGKTKTSKHRREKRELIHKEMELQHEKQAEESAILKVTEFITVNELATMMNVPVNKLISTCLSVGLFVSINQRLEKENIILLAEEYGFQVQFSDTELEDEVVIADDDANLEPRAPIVTVMGHVDHGKTSLLDYIRKTNVIAGEAGGITQHIGAYEVQLPDGRKITFLDTPGHEAFTAMRARGAKITDIVIIVIAADDTIMPQTVEAINHAQAAGVPMIFAINKIDKPGADPDKIRTALANMNLLVEEWGGKIQSQDISAKKGINVDILLEKVLIEAEMLELKANPNAVAVGTVIESSLDKGRGYVAKMLVQNGTLRKGDIVVAGTSYGKIKAMYNERNQLVTSAGPSSPVLLLGLDSAPQAGDTFRVMSEDKEAKNLVSKRLQLIREQGLRTQKHITLTEIGRRIAIGDFKELNIIVKGDVDGSVEALSDSLLRLTTEEVQVNVIHKSVGQVTESDVLLASASNAIIIAFQVRPSGGAKRLAEQEQVDIRTYSVIYDAINELKDAIEGMKAPEMKETIVCNIEVREVFRISKVGAVAGCYVLDGKVQRTTRIRIIRDGIVIFTGRLGSLKRFKDDVKEVTAGYECGLNIESFNDIKVGDIIEGFEEVVVNK